MSFSQALTSKQNAVLTAFIKDAPYKCVFCKKVFISETYLSRHKTRRHGLPSTSFLQLKEQAFESELCDGWLTERLDVSKSSASNKLKELIHRLDDKPLTSTPLPELYHTCYSISPKPVPAPRLKQKIDISTNTDPILIPIKYSVSTYAKPVTKDVGVNTEISCNETSTNTKSRILSRSDTFRNSFVPLDIEPLKLEDGGAEWQEVAYEFSESMEESDSKSSSNQFSRTEISPDRFLEQLFEKLKNNYHKDDNQRLQTEEMFESKLRELGLDPEWKGLEVSTMQHAEVFLKSKRNSIAKKYPNFYYLREKLCQEVENLVKERGDL